MAFRTQKELFDLYESVPYNPKAKVPKLSETESGDEALEKMLIFIPPEHRKYLLWKCNIRQMLFKEDDGAGEKDDGIIRVIVICRVSTAGDIQDPRSAIDQLAELIELQERDPTFRVVGVCLDFFKNGRKTRGRLIFDEVIDKLYDTSADGLVPIFNAISFPEVARLSRRASVIFETAEHCFYFNLKMFRQNERVDLAHPSKISTLASLASEAQSEIYSLGQRIARGKKAQFKRFRTQQGTDLFGFKVENIKSEDGEIVESLWKKIPVEFEAKKFMYEQFLRTPNYKTVAKEVKKRYSLNVDPKRISSILLDRRSIGIILKPDKERVLNPETENIVYRYFPLPEDIANDFTPTDRPPFKYFVLDIVSVELDLYQAVIDRIAQKIGNIEPSQLGQCRHRPRRENGQHALSGLIQCHVGDCRDDYIMSGSKKYPDYFGCNGRRGKRKTCTQDHYFRGEALLIWVIQGIESFLLESFPSFYPLYREACQREENSIFADIKVLEHQKSQKEEALKRFVSGVDKFSGVTQCRLERLVQLDTEDLERINDLIKARKHQLNFLSMNLPLDDTFVKTQVGKIRELLLKDPLAANEALRHIIDRIEIHQVESVDGNSTRLVARIVCRIRQLAPFFSTDFVLKDFLSPNVSIKAPSAIAQPTLIEAEILQNFEVLLPISQGGRGKGAKNMGFSVLWRHIPLMEKPTTITTTWTSQDNEGKVVGEMNCSIPDEKVEALPHEKTECSNTPDVALSISTPQPLFQEKKALSDVLVKNGIRFQFNLFTEKYEPIIPKNLRIKRRRYAGKSYTISYEVLVDGQAVMVPEMMERRPRGIQNR